MVFVCEAELVKPKTLHLEPHVPLPFGSAPLGNARSGSAPSSQSVVCRIHCPRAVAQGREELERTWES